MYYYQIKELFSFSISFIIFIPNITINFQQVQCSSAMKRLYEDLFTDYNRLILPVASNKTKVVVTLGLKLGQILDLNLKQQILSTNVWVEQTWHDYKLVWNPEHYEGIDMIHVPAENIWIPDIVLFNNADGNYELTLVAKARLYSNGTVVWKPPTMFRSTCEIDVEYFPFDIQTCFLRFGSWTYAGDELELKHVGSDKRKVEIGIDLSQFYKNVEWDIIDVPAYYNEVYYECCNEPFPDITFKIVIRRKMLFYLVNLILPVALMTFMTVSVFYLPSDSNEKVTLSISILTSLIVFFLLMLEIIPASSLAVPLFGKYLLFTLVLVSLSACVSVYVLNIHHRSPSVHSMSPTIRKIFLKTLPRLLRLNRPDPRERSSLNRFRKKKIAQQLLDANNKVYDLAQPLAASLNLIETLHKSYDFRKEDDTLISSNNTDDEEGRYFRRYVDSYIERLKKDIKLKGINCNRNSLIKSRNKFCSKDKTGINNVNSNFTQNKSLSSRHLATGCCVGLTNLNNTESSAEIRCPLVSDNQSSNCLNYCNCESKSYKHQNGILNDDTLDMTFDYDDQENINNNSSRCSIQQQQKQLIVDDLPSPPPPPKPLTHMSDPLQNKSGRTSSCSKNIAPYSSQESCLDTKRINDNDINKKSGNIVLHDNEKDHDDELSENVIDHGKLVNKLINSINFINNVSDEIDTSTTSNDDCSQYPNISIDNYKQNHLSDWNSDNIIHSQHNHTDDISLNQKFHSQNLNKSIDENNINQFRQTIPTIANNSAEENQYKLCTCKISQTQYDNSYQEQQNHFNFDKKQSINFNQEQTFKKPSDLLLSLRLSYDEMPPHVRAAIRSILFIADTIKNEDDENSAVEDWESVSMVVDRLFLWIFFILCTFGSLIILALAPSLYDQRVSIDDKLRIDIPPSNCSASVAH